MVQLCPTVDQRKYWKKVCGYTSRLSKSADLETLNLSFSTLLMFFSVRLCSLSCNILLFYPPTAWHYTFFDVSSVSFKRQGNNKHSFLCACMLSCPTLCDSMNCGLSGSSVHWISQARTLEWLPIPPSGDLPDLGIQPMSPAASALADRFFTTEPPAKPHIVSYSNAIKVYLYTILHV